MRSSLATPYDVVDLVLGTSGNQEVWSISPRQLLPFRRLSRFVLGGATETVAVLDNDARCDKTDDANKYTDLETLSCDTDSSTFSVSSDVNPNAHGELVNASQSTGIMSIEHAQRMLHEDALVRVTQVGKCLKVFSNDCRH